MAVILIETKDGDREVVRKEVPDGSALLEVCGDVGIAFGCCTGSCGVCQVKVLEGAENITQNPDPRGGVLACLSSVISGTVRLQV